MYKFYPIKNNLKLKTPIHYGNQYLCPIRFKNNQVFIQTPIIKISYVDELKLYIDFDDDDIDPKIYQFKQFINNIKINIDNELNQKIQSWIPEHQSISTMSYNSPIFNNNIKLTLIPFITTVLNNDGIEIDFRKIKITKDMKMNAIIELQYVYMTSDTYGINIKLHKIRLYEYFSQSQLNNMTLEPDVCPYCKNITPENNIFYISPPPPPPPPPQHQSIISHNLVQKNKILSKIINPQTINMSNIINEIKNGINLRKTPEKSKAVESNKDIRNISSNDLIEIKLTLRHITI